MQPRVSRRRATVTLPHVLTRRDWVYIPYAWRLITLIGVKPIGGVQWKRDNFYLYGVVEPKTYESFFYEFSHLDSSCYQHFIEMVSAHWSDSVVVMQMDQGKFHSARDLDWPENIIPIFQPPHSPERGSNWALMGTSQSAATLVNFQSLKQLRFQLSRLLEKLTPELIASLTGWEFITTAVLSSSS